MTVHATTERDGSAIVSIAGDRRKVLGADLHDARTKIGNLVVAHAAQLGEPVRFVTTDPEGSWTMVVYPDGHMVNERDAVPAVPSEAASAPPEAATQTPGPMAPSTPPAAAQQPSSRRSFLRKQQIEKPASKGWRAAANRAGMNLKPGRAELAERADVRAVSLHWPGPRTISVLN